MKRKITENPFGKPNTWQEQIYKELHKYIKQSHPIRTHYHKLLWIRKEEDQKANTKQ